MRKVPTAMSAVVAAGLSLTTVVALVPAIPGSLHAPALHVSIETASALSAALAAALFLGRYRQGWRRGDLLLVAALGILASSNFFFQALPAIAGSRGHSFSLWASLAAVSIGAALLVCSALARPQSLRHSSRAAAKALLIAAGILALIAALAGSLAPSLPAVADAVGSSPGLLNGNPAVLILQALTTVLFAIAAVGFLRRATRSEDELTSWLAVGVTFAAMARAEYLLFPSVNSELVYLGDAFRLGFYLCLLIGAFREIRQYQERLAEAAILDERQRISRELHDGLSQELALISVQSRRLANGFDERIVEQLTAAAGRALDESRGAISSLRSPVEQSFGPALAEAAEQVARRHNVKLRLIIEPSVEVPLQAREAMRRIVREAVANAARHGNAGTVTVQVTNNEHSCQLRILDDGSGFDGSSEASSQQDGYGLVSMRERAAGIGAHFRVRSRPGHGTEVEVVLP